MTFSDKIKRSREVAGLTQQELADQVGVSKRTIASYECTDAIARRSTTVKLARALKVSVRYLTDDSCTDPLADIEKDDHVEEARRLYGASGAKAWRACSALTPPCSQAGSCPRTRRTLSSKP